MEFSNEEIHAWVLSLNLSKEVNNFPRDFSDGVLLAEIIARFLPRYISLNTFTRVYSLALKKYNWETLQKCVLRHLHIRLSAHQVNQLVNAEEGAIERLISLVRQRVAEALESKRFRPTGSLSAQLSRKSSKEFLNNIDEVLPLTLSCGEVKMNTTFAQPQGKLPIPIMENATKDQLIKKLYSKIRWQENLLSKKDEQIEMLSKRVDSLLQIACTNKLSLQNRALRNPPPARCPTMIHDDDDFLANVDDPPNQR